MVGLGFDSGKCQRLSLGGGGVLGPGEGSGIAAQGPILLPSTGLEQGDPQMQFPFLCYAKGQRSLIRVIQMCSLVSWQVEERDRERGRTTGSGV